MKLIKLLSACALAIGSISGVMAEEHLNSVNPAYIDNSIKAGDDFYPCPAPPR